MLSLWKRYIPINCIVFNSYTVYENKAILYNNNTNAHYTNTVINKFDCDIYWEKTTSLKPTLVMKYSRHYLCGSYSYTRINWFI